MYQVKCCIAIIFFLFLFYIFSYEFIVPKYSNFLEIVNRRRSKRVTADVLSRYDCHSHKVHFMKDIVSIKKQILHNVRNTFLTNNLLLLEKMKNVSPVSRYVFAFLFFFFPAIIGTRLSGRCIKDDNHWAERMNMSALQYPKSSLWALTNESVWKSTNRYRKNSRVSTSDCISTIRRYVRSISMHVSLSSKYISIPFHNLDMNKILLSISFTICHWDL